MSGGGGSSSDGGNDMQVSGMEAAVSKEKGIHTHSDTRVSSTSFSPGGGGGSQDKGGHHYTGPTMGPDYNTGQYSDVGIGSSGKLEANVNRDWSDSEIEKGYTNEGQKLSNVNGVYMTKSEMYNKGIVEKDPVTGQEVMGRNTINPNTGKLEKADKTFKEHWEDAPDYLPLALRLLYAGGKNIGDWMNKRNFKGYNEAGARGKFGNAIDYYNQRGVGNVGPAGIITGGQEGRDLMNQLAPQAPYLVSGLQQPSSSAAQNWFSNLGSGSGTLSFQAQYNAAKTKQQGILGNPSSYGWLAVNQSPFYNWLKENSLDKGIL